MHQVLFIDDGGTTGPARFQVLKQHLDGVSFLHCDAAALPRCLDVSNRWDLLVADLAGLTEVGQRWTQQFVEANPDAILVLVADGQDPSTAQAALRLGAVDCVPWDRSGDRLAKVLRRILVRLTVAYAAINTMDCRIEKLDLTTTLVFSADSVDSLVHYVLRHTARMEVCGLRCQFRAVRALEECLKGVFRNGLRLHTAEVSDPPEADFAEELARHVPVAGEQVMAQTRMHFSADGIRFTIHSRYGSWESEQLWFTQLFMDEVGRNAGGDELTMLQLPDTVSQQVSEAIQRCRVSSRTGRNLLTDALKSEVDEVFRSPLPGCEPGQP